MGLDMYLTKEIDLWGYEPVQSTITVKGKYTDTQHIEKDVQLVHLQKLVYEAAYWRKANHIHKWFVDKVQEGHDDCTKYYVSKDKLKELLSTCEKVLQIAQSHITETQKKEKYEELLPTCSGFFFGNTDYDENYLGDIEETITMLNNEIQSENWESSDVSYFYQSSW